MRKPQLYCRALSLSLLSIVITPSVFAAVPGFNIGVDYGRTEAKKFCDNITNCDSVDNGPKFEVGYSFNEMFSTELGYTSFGTLLESNDSTFTAKQDANAITLTALAEMPINTMFGLYLRGGIAWYNTDDKGEVNGVAVHDHSGTTPIWGVGTKWTINERFAMRIEYQGYLDISRADGHEDDVQGLYAGVLFQL